MSNECTKRPLPATYTNPHYADVVYCENIIQRKGLRSALELMIDKYSGQIQNDGEYGEAIDKGRKALLGDFQK